MWYQVFNKEDAPGNYLEASGSLMLAYAMMKSARTGMLNIRYQEIGKRVYESVLSHYLRNEDGKVVLGGICASAGLGYHPDTGAYRSGSVEYYTVTEPVIPNNGHGLGALFLAENEYLML